MTARDLAAAVREAMHNAVTWIENYPLNSTTEFTDDWVVIAAELRGASAVLAALVQQLQQALVERDEARADTDEEIWERLAQSEARAVRAEEALHTIAGWVEASWREGDKEFQLAIIAREALVSGGET